MNADSPRWVDPKQDRAILPHGFRSIFKDWTTELTGFADSLVDFAMSHALDDDTEAVYHRGDMIEKRRKPIEAWAAYCEPAERNPASPSTIEKSAEPDRSAVQQVHRRPRAAARPSYASAANWAPPVRPRHHNLIRQLFNDAE